MLIGPIVLASLSLLFGLAAFLPAGGIIHSAVAAVHGVPLEFELYLWHGINLPLMLSLLALVVGAVLFCEVGCQVLNIYQRLTFIDRFGPERGYEKFMDGLVRGWPTGRRRCCRTATCAIT
jgi:multicomponent Na+:H+ antiporter subunit A